MAGLATARVGRDGGDVFDAANLHASASEGTKRGHTTRTRGLGSAATCQRLTSGGKRASALDWQCAWPRRHPCDTLVEQHYQCTTAVLAATLDIALRRFNGKPPSWLMLSATVNLYGWAGHSLSDTSTPHRSGAYHQMSRQQRYTKRWLTFIPHVVNTCGAELDVQGSHSELLAAGSHILHQPRIQSCDR